MRLNLLLDNEADIRSGYTNIDPSAQKGDPLGRTPCELHNLDAIVDDAEADEIIAYDILDYFPGTQADQVLQHWLRKLAHKGKLTISTIDLFEVAKGIRDGLLPLDEANDLIYGVQEKSWDFRKCGFGLVRLVEVLTNLGYRIIHKRTNNYKAFVTCERP